MLLAFGLVRLLPSLELAHVPRLGEVTVDVAFLVGAVAVTLVTSLLFGCAPVLRTMAPRFAQTTRSDAGFSAAGSPSVARNRTRVAQLLERLRSMTEPGKVAVTARLPTQPGGPFSGLLQLPALAGRVPAHLRPVNRDYFQVLRLPIVDGRGFEAVDRPGQPPAVIVSRQLARAFPEGRVLGQNVHLISGPLEGIPLRVVGVAGDVVANSVESVVRPDVHILIDQLPSGRRFQSLLGATAFFVVRGDADATALVPTIRMLVKQIDPRLSIDNVITLGERVSATVAQPRTNAVLVGLFAGVAVLLTGIGLYGLVAYNVSERTQEIGIRMADGAAAADVLALVMKQSTLLVVPGILLGLGGAAALSGYLEGMLFGLTPLDPRIFAVVPALVIVVLAVASYLPARRATKVDPVVALRGD